MQTLGANNEYGVTGMVYGLYKIFRNVFTIENNFNRNRFLFFNNSSNKVLLPYQYYVNALPVLGINIFRELTM